MSVQQVGMWVLAAGLVLVFALWSTRPVSPLWPAAVFGVTRAAMSYLTGATVLTAAGTGVAALVLGGLYFWLLQLTRGRPVWWVILVAGVVLFSI